MNTGNANKNGHKNDQPRAVSLRFQRGRLIVALKDQREVSLPLSWYPTLQRAKPAQRASWELLGDGSSFHWEALDLDLSTAGLVVGAPERIPAPPKPRKLKLTAKGAA